MSFAHSFTRCDGREPFRPILAREALSHVRSVYSGEAAMKIDVIGGTGLNAVTGQGLSNALVGADIVVDVTNAPSLEPEAVLDFFRTSARNLGKAEAAARVRHHVALSIVGSERMPENTYFAAKVAQEE